MNAYKKFRFAIEEDERGGKSASIFMLDEKGFVVVTYKKSQPKAKCEVRQ